MVFLLTAVPLALSILHGTDYATSRVHFLRALDLSADLIETLDDVALRITAQEPPEDGQYALKSLGRPALP
jgi:hypothetical protein